MTWSTPSSSVVRRPGAPARGRGAGDPGLPRGGVRHPPGAGGADLARYPRQHRQPPLRRGAPPGSARPPVRHLPGAASCAAAGRAEHGARSAELPDFPAARDPGGAGPSRRLPGPHRRPPPLARGSRWSGPAWSPAAESETFYSVFAETSWGRLRRLSSRDSTRPPSTTAAAALVSPLPGAPVRAGRRPPTAGSPCSARAPWSPCSCTRRWPMRWRPTSSPRGQSRVGGRSRDGRRRGSTCWTTRRRAPKGCGAPPTTRGRRSFAAGCCAAA